MSDHGESKLSNRIIFKLTGRWPQSVVDSRLAEANRPVSLDDPRLANVRSILDSWPGPGAEDNDGRAA